MRILPRLLALSGAWLVATSGCGKKADVKNQMAELEKAFPAAASALSAASAPAANSVSSSGRATDADACVSRALMAVRANDYAGGVIALQAVPRMRGVSPQQLMAVERTKQTITADLQARAIAGDAQAKAALAAIEKTHSQ